MGGSFFSRAGRLGFIFNVRRACRKPAALFVVDKETEFNPCGDSRPALAQTRADLIVDFGTRRVGNDLIDTRLKSIGEPSARIRMHLESVCIVGLK